LLDNCGTWQACEDEAVLQDAHLVTINDAEEQVWLTDTFGCFTIEDCREGVGEKTKDFWIGLRCEGEHCWECWDGPPGSNPEAWFWISGEEYDYSNWVDNCTLLYPDGPYVVCRQPTNNNWNWDHRPADGDQDAIIERTPEERWETGAQAEASTAYGLRSVSGSKRLNYLAILLVPAAAIVWRRWRRRG
jgi:hypothetical protein